MRSRQTKPRRRRLITVQINLDELDSLEPMLRARIIGRAHRKSAEEARLQRFQDAMDIDDD